MKRLLLASILVASTAFGDTLIDFEDVSEGPFLAVVNSRGYTFIGSDNPGGFPLMAIRNSPTATTGDPNIADSGSRYLVHSDGGQPGFFPVITMTADDAKAFSLISFEYGEDNVGQAHAERIEVTGTTVDGATVSAEFYLDGVADGYGGAADFQTAMLSPDFQNLVSVVFFGPALKTSVLLADETKAFSLDNVYVAITALQVSIDIKPGSHPNCFNINGHGVIPVAVLSSETFDAASIDVTTVSFGGLDVRVRGNKAPLCSLEDVTNDGLNDLVCQFQDDPENWDVGEDEATLTGETIDGREIEGTDSICIVP